MPIAVIINNKINGNCLFLSHSESLVMQSGFAVPEESLCGHDWVSVHALQNAACLGSQGAIFGDVGLCRAMDSPPTLPTDPSRQHSWCTAWRATLALRRSGSARRGGVRCPVALREGCLRQSAGL